MYNLILSLQTAVADMKIAFEPTTINMGRSKGCVMSLVIFKTMYMHKEIVGFIV
jgi:hypothetical protein